MERRCRSLLTVTFHRSSLYIGATRAGDCGNEVVEAWICWTWRGTDHTHNGQHNTSTVDSDMVRLTSENEYFREAVKPTVKPSKVGP